MWLFTKHGFFSVVCARQNNGGYGEPIDEHRLMVRARVRSHLLSLQEQFPDLLANCEIRQYPNTDYAFRLFVSKAAWSEVVKGLVQETDYDNFKSAVAQHLGGAGKDYQEALHDTWGVMYRLQQ